MGYFEHELKFSISQKEVLCQIESNEFKCWYANLSSNKCIPEFKNSLMIIASMVLTLKFYNLSAL